MEYLLYLLPMVAFAIVLVLRSGSRDGRRSPSRYDIHPDHEAEIAALRSEADERGHVPGQRPDRHPAS